MTYVNAPRWQGDDYQADFFWLQACIFLSSQNASKIMYEANGEKSFDDIAVYYNNNETDSAGKYVVARHFQVKFHTTPGVFGWASLIEPSFINAEKVSLFERLYNVYKKHRDTGEYFLYLFVTNWSINPNDQLSHLMREEKIDRSTLARKKYKVVRDAWKEKLSIDNEEELYDMLDHFQIHFEGSGYLNTQYLNSQLQLAGLQRTDQTKYVNPYRPLIRNVVCDHRNNTFDKDQLIELCKHEKLWVGAPTVPEPTFKIGIKSFSRRAEKLEEETDATLSLLDYFNGRVINNSTLWNGEVVGRIQQFIENATKDSAKKYELRLDVHASIAFVSGYFLDMKSGLDLRILQSTSEGKSIWRHSETGQKDQTPLLVWDLKNNSSYDSSLENEDIALVVNITHPITADVIQYIASELPTVNRIFCCELEGGARANAIKNGEHASMLAQEIALELKTKRTQKEREGVVHLFFSAPNGFVFFLGRHSKSFGQWVMYEYDFDTNKPAAYQRSISMLAKKGEV